MQPHNHPRTSGRDIVVLSDAGNETIVSRLGKACFYLFAGIAVVVSLIGAGMCIMQLYGGAYEAYLWYAKDALTYDRFYYDRGEFNSGAFILGLFVIAAGGVTWVIGYGIRYVLSGIR
jgi:hypothetical protein